MHNRYSGRRSALSNPRKRASMVHSAMRRPAMSRSLFNTGNMSRLEGRVLEAEQLYEQAIRSAHSNGFANNEAIAYELAARFYAGRGLHKFADSYLLEA